MEPPHDDVLLVRRCGEGDPGAKRSLLLRVLPAMRGATRSLLPQVADADDALQQAMVDLLSGLPTYRGQGRVEAWARTIAVRASLRLLAKRRRHLGVVEPDDNRDAAAPTPDESLHESLPRSVRAYLAELPAVQREALVLRHGLGYTVPEIARLCDESVNTIKSRLVTARKQVRRLIRQDEAVAEVGSAVRRGSEPDRGAP